MSEISYQSYVDSIKKSAVSAGKKLLIQAVAKKVPWLFVPVLGPLTEIVIGKLVELLINETEFGIFFLYIDMRTDAQGRAFSLAAAENYKAQQSGTPEEKAKAEKELIDKFRAFVIIRN